MTSLHVFYELKTNESREDETEIEAKHSQAKHMHRLQCNNVCFGVQQHTTAY